MSPETLLRPPPLTCLSEKTTRFQDASRERAAQPPISPRAVSMDAAFFGRYARRPYWERYARSLAAALQTEPVYLFPHEQMVGMLYQIGRNVVLDQEIAQRWQPYSCWEHIGIRQQQEIEPYLRVGASAGHIGWHWEWILDRGIDGILREHQAHLADSRDIRARRLYKGAIILWQAVLNWNARHIRALQRQAEDASAEEKARLHSLIVICQRVPCYPATTFREAVQSFHMQHLALMFENPYGGNGPGRVDQLLWPYLQCDLAKGVITWQEARELIDELLMRFDERLYLGDGWVEAVTVGGSLADGTSTVNPLSYLIIQSIQELDQVHPAVYVRLSRTSPAEFVELTSCYLVKGHNRAQVYNDDACLPAIRSGGVAAEDAATYMAGGCMEPSPQGQACDLNFTGTHSVAKTLELVLNGGIDMLSGQRRIAWGRVLADYPAFEDLFEAFAAELEREYGGLTRAMDIASECMAKYRPCYLLSSLVQDCVERGREQQDGGARYHDYGFAPLGITAAADSLNAIWRMVYRDKLISAETLLEALRSNYAGHETLRSQLDYLPRFGQEDSEADAITARVLSVVSSAAALQRTRFGGRLKPMVFNFVWTPGFSRELGARADGRFAGSLIGHGLTPSSTAMGRGITVAMNSTFKLDCSALSGIGTTMWDMDERWINPELMRSLLLTFFAGGGMVFQGNTTGVRELQEALLNPERYQHLIVRVGGFSARFVSLERALQEEIILRHRHAE
jgi:trans-4-hydroxy-L-proline dehydratase